eukprot:TRINITY_DN6520_c0_g1_i3.p1 TRINITY_DN6520_c0_g1~~TRINITY_DN6520_c0_g1_i3.p1  ORF type:complete len:131 (+),score=9.53 TRINITY_DN6520_c0_g1_i3:191-583(+)
MAAMGCATRLWRTTDCCMCRPPSHSFSCSKILNSSNRFSSIKRIRVRRLRTATRNLRMYSNSKADDSLPSQMSLENALKVLGVLEHSSFEEILSAKNSILERNKDNPELIAQVAMSQEWTLRVPWKTCHK